jgi:hypothetical protein
MPKGLSLHIGIDHYDRKAYRRLGKNLSPLPNCVNDAMAMRSLAMRSHFTSAMLLNEKVTEVHLARGIELAAWYLDHGDIFFLTFSGHGGRAFDHNQDEDCGFDQTWCLYDKEVVDDDLFEFWKLFRPGVRIVVIADSCHSGTSVKNYSEEVICGTQQVFRNPKQDDVQASCLLMAACQDRQLASAGPNITLSLYTHWLVKIMGQSELCDSYSDLHEKIRENMPLSSQPNLFTFGPNADQLARSRPFKI